MATLNELVLHQRIVRLHRADWSPTAYAKVTLVGTGENRMVGLWVDIYDTVLAGEPPHFPAFLLPEDGWEPYTGPVHQDEGDWPGTAGQG